MVISQPSSEVMVPENQLCSMQSAEHFFVDEGAVILDGRDITYEKEHKRSKYNRTSVSGSDERHGSEYEH